MTLHEDAIDHQAEVGDPVIASKCFGQSFVVASQSSVSAEPAERSLDDPAPRQQDKALLRFGVLDDFQFDVVFGRRVLRFLPRVALIDVSQFDTAVSQRLDLLGQLSDLCSLLPAPARSCSLLLAPARSCPLLPAPARSCPLLPAPARWPA